MSSCHRILQETLFQSDKLISKEIDLSRGDTETQPYPQKFAPCCMSCQVLSVEMAACPCHLLLEMGIG